MKPYIGMYLFAGFLIMLTAVTDLALPGIMQGIVNVGIVENDTAYILTEGGIMLALTLANLMFWILASYYDAKASFFFTRDLRKDVFARVLDSSVDQLDQMGTASLINRTTGDISMLEFAVFRILRMGIVAPFIGIGGIILAFRISVEISLLFIVAFVILAVLSVAIFSKAIPVFKAIFPKTDKVNRVLRENLTGIRVIRAFNKDDDEKRRFDEANTALTETSIQSQKIMAWYSPLTSLVMNITIIAILYFGAIQIDVGNFTPGELIAMLQYATLILGAFRRLSMIFIMLPRFSAAANRVSELLDMKNTINEFESVLSLLPEDNSLVFDDVTFSYGQSQNPVLNNVSFTAESGKTTAIIGGTGSGKSTIMQLILRFYDVQSGTVRVGGMDVRQLDKSALRQHMGYVAQKVELFTGSIAENLAYGGAFDDEDMRRSAKVAQAESFILADEMGYERRISQGGKNFSGGQKQRLSIARALARKPNVLLFDDSFSALDYETDAALRQALHQYHGNTTILIVAQRIATVMHADRVVVLNEGRVEAIGTHKELLDSSALYRALAYSQLSEEEVTV
ncbi:MAG: ABC transporter ATP-binding protein [Clostridia bacterium]|nr:ABC transporter ATP-binding protein [Clostridia bacterium]